MLQAAGSDLTKAHRAGRLRLGIPSALDMQTICYRPLCGGCDPPRIRIRQGLRKRSVIAVRETAVCWQIAELIERLPPLTIPSSLSRAEAFSMNDASAVSQRLA